MTPRGPRSASSFKSACLRHVDPRRIDRGASIAMAWATIDKPPEKRRRGGAEDAERRELRLRRTYNEAAAGHQRIAAKKADAPKPEAIADLYRAVLNDVGAASTEDDAKEAPWDKALRLACARHLSELLEATGDADGAVEAACAAADAARTDAGFEAASKARLRDTSWPLGRRDGSRRRRGCRADSPKGRVAAAPRVPRG